MQALLFYKSFLPKILGGPLRGFSEADFVSGFLLNTTPIVGRLGVAPKSPGGKAGRKDLRTSFGDNPGSHPGSRALAPMFGKPLGLLTRGAMRFTLFQDSGMPIGSGALDRPLDHPS